MPTPTRLSHGLRRFIAGQRLALACVGALVAGGAARAAEPGPEFAPLDLAPLFNQPHTNAFPEAPEGFTQGWFEEPDFTLSRLDETATWTPWRPEFATAQTPPDFAAWAAAALFGPEFRARQVETRIPFRVGVQGHDVVAFDRNTASLTKAVSAAGRRANAVHLLACAGWFPRGTMGLSVRYSDGAREEREFETFEWSQAGGPVAISFAHGTLFHHVVTLSHPDKAIDTIEISDTQVGPQLLLVAVTLESGPARAATLPDDERQAEWQRLAAAVVRFDDATLVIAPDAEALVRFAGQELQRYLYGVSGRLLPIAVQSAAGRPAIRLRVDADLRGDAFRLRLRGKELRLEGATAVAVQYAAYDLLERFGVGFTLGGDTLPAGRIPLLIPADLDLEAQPVFAVRGSLPWYNFLNSPTTWNDGDFRFFFDQLAKQKANFVGFHTYDSEPYATYEADGELRAGEPLVGSTGYGWGAVRQMKTSEFGFGTADLFDTDNFASSATLVDGDRTTRIRNCQEQLRRGLAYARSRGIRTCLGFEASGDPTEATEQRRFLERLRQVLVTYPALDYVWIWQSEGLGTQGWPVPPADSGLARLAREHFGTFAYLGSRERI